MGATIVTVETSLIRKVRGRLLPFLVMLYFAAFIDRVNVSFAALTMNRDLGLNAYAYGLGAGIFFLGYCLFEVPSNLILYRVGARRWIARIMITWSLIGAAMAFVQGPESFWSLRFLLGVAEAGFFPGIVYYLTRWAPATHRAQMIGTFMAAIPISTALGAPLSGAILHLDGVFGVAGWRWLFLCEAVPSLLLGVCTWMWLPDSPAEAKWLTAGEKEWLARVLEAEAACRDAKYRGPLFRTLTDPRILALSVCYFGADMGLYGVVLWVPQVLASAGVPESSVIYVVAIPYALAAIAMIFWSRHSDRTRERLWHIAGASLLGFAGLAATAYLTDSPRLAVLAVTVGAIGTLAILPIFWLLPAAILGGAAAAAGIALINTVGNVGGFAGPYIVGWVKATTGSFTYGLLVVAGGLLLSGIMVLLIGHDSRSELPISAAAVTGRGNSG